MACYAIGDVQGCYDELRELLDVIAFDPAEDRLWLVGDLVNRGANSLQTLRFLRSLGNAAVCVMGNHDFYLLYLACNPGAMERKRHDTLQEVLDAPDREVLLDWLRQRPLLHVENDYVLVHAGLPPGWTVRQARARSAEVEAVLSGEQWQFCLPHLWGNLPASWEEDLEGFARLRVVVNAMMRMRFCNADGGMEFDAKGPPDKAPPAHYPWFLHPARTMEREGVTVVCGHWSALGLYLTPHVVALDTGCVWGGVLTALRLEDRAVFQVQGSSSGVRRGRYAR